MAKLWFRPFVVVCFMSIMTAILITHCKKEEQDVIINDNVILPEENSDLLNVIINGDTVLLIYKPGSSLPEFTSENIVVGAKDGGYLKKVVTATPEGDTVNLITEQAALTDAVEKGSIDTTFSLSLQGQQMGPILIDTIITGNSGKRYHINFSGDKPSLIPMGEIFEIRIPNVVIEIYNGGNLAVTVTIDTLILSKNIDVYLNLDINSGAITYFALLAHASDEVNFRNVTMDIQQSISDDIEIVLTSLNLGTIVVWIGPVPVVFAFEFGIYAGVNAEVTVSASLEIENNVDLSSENIVGAEYTGSWQAINDWTLDGNAAFNFSPSTSINISLTNYLKGSLDTKIYGVLGPTLYLKPYQYNTASYPPFNYELGVGLGAGLGFEVEILDWSLAEFNYTFVDYTEPIIYEGTLKWKYLTGGIIRSSPAIGTDGTVYVGSFDGYLYSINPDGSLKWQYQVGDTVVSSPAIGSDGTIYVGSLDGYLYAISSNGTLKWRYQTGDAVGSSPAIGTDGTIYIGSDDYCLYAINSNGTLKWNYHTNGDIWSSPAVDVGGTIYFGCCDNYLYALNPDGTLKWRYYAGHWVGSAPAIGSDGAVYFGSDDNYLYAINSDGTLKWKYLTGGIIRSSPAIGSDGTIYVGSLDGYLYAISSNGTLKWKYYMYPVFDSSPAISSNGTIYVGTDDYYLYAINSDGTLKWKYFTGGHIRSSPNIHSDGTVYIGSYDHYLYAVRSYGTSANTSWPMFHHDLKHTGRVGGGF